MKTKTNEMKCKYLIFSIYDVIMCYVIVSRFCT